MTLDHVESLIFFLPGVVLAGLIVLLILADLLPRKRPALVPVLTSLGLAGILVWMIVSVRSYPEPAIAGLQEIVLRGDVPELLAPAALFGGVLAYDAFGLFFQLAFVLAALLVAVYSWPVVKRWKDGQGEYYVMLLSLLLGMFVMSSARTLLMMYLSIEFVSITSFIMAGMLRRNRKSAEAALKYIIYSASASGVMLFGMSLLYGLTGTLDVGEIGATLAARGVPSTTVVILSVLTMGGFAYKIAAVPFHLWCPDVYEGAPTPVAAFFSVGPKAAGLAILARFLTGIFVPSGTLEQPLEWQFAIALLAVMTMALGNFSALWQNNLKRLLAYSSIAHAGTILLAFTVLGPDNLATVAFYAFLYTIMNLGAFFVVGVLEEQYGIETVEQCRGIGYRLPGLCALMTIFMISLAGLPPTAGFVAKLWLFGFLLKHGGMIGVVLVVLGVLFSVVSLGYYARVFGAMFLAGPREDVTAKRMPAVQGGILYLLGAATLVLGVWFSWLYRLAHDAGHGFLQ